MVLSAVLSCFKVHVTQIILRLVCVFRHSDDDDDEAIRSKGGMRSLWCVNGLHSLQD